MTALPVIDPHWRARPPLGCTPRQIDWLTDHSSLTARLRQLGPVEIVVVRELQATPWHDEHRLLGLGGRDRVWVREVVLRVGGVPCVYARSVTPLTDSHRAWRAMRALGTRPLAELLYASADVSRSGLASQCITPAHPLFARVRKSVAGRLPQLMVARRSVFHRHAAPLLVAECLLPCLLATRAHG